MTVVADGYVPPMYSMEPEAVTAAVASLAAPVVRNGAATGRREWSWDFCINYFSATDDPTAEMEKSCLQLGYYLASWGMLRGSSWLFKNAHPRHYTATIETIARHSPTVRDLDLSDYTDTQARAALISAYADIKGALLPDGNEHATAVTKVMLGVWGNIPAFDTYLRAGLRSIVSPAERAAFNTVNDRSLELLNRIYRENQGVIDQLANSHDTVIFSDHAAPSRSYTRAKVLDAAGFALGEQLLAGPDRSDEAL